MLFARNVGEKYELRVRKEAESPDNDLAHVKAEIATWKAIANR
jgi:hypothetical protein